MTIPSPRVTIPRLTTAMRSMRPKGKPLALPPLFAKSCISHHRSLGHKCVQRKRADGLVEVWRLE